MRNSKEAVTETAKPVDLVHLARQTFGDTQLEREVLELFLTQSQIYLARMRAADDQRKWAEAIHTIKGSARGIGAWSVADAAAEAEQADYQAGSDTVVALADRLSREVDETNRYIETLFAA